jgi:hypothetical protein
VPINARDLPAMGIEALRCILYVGVLVLVVLRIEARLTTHLLKDLAPGVGIAPVRFLDVEELAEVTLPIGEDMLGRQVDKKNVVLGVAPEER